MRVGRVKCLLVAVFSLFSCAILAQGEPGEGKKEKKGFDANEVIFGHVLDAHEFHFFSYRDGDGREHAAIVPLPVILYSPQKGVSMFMSSEFHHGSRTYKGYSLLTQEKIEEEKLDTKKYSAGQIIPVNEAGEIDRSVSVYDVSLTRNVVQMIIALVLLVWLMVSIAKKYRAGQGVSSAPKGSQSLMEPVINFIRDDVAKPNLGSRYRKYLPYLLTVFFFILINNLVALIPGTANVTGNIAFTLVLAAVSFIVILASSNKHYWSHIFNPPVPGGVKPILVLVEVLGIFTKPFALMIRLFANMIAGHIIIICLISLIFIFGAMNKAIGWGFSPLSVAFVIFIYFIEILVAFLQAYIFTNLTAVFVGQAFEGGHDDVDHHEDPLIV
ncbi:MAG TPA: F0F1 ATP synthase subunit A [Chitinophagaceae bacterium]